MSKHTSFHLTFLFCLLLQAALPLTLHAAVNDIFAGDFFPQQPGTKTVAIYAYDRNSGGPYAGSRKRLDGSVDTSILVLRVSQTFRIGGTTITPLMVLPWSQTAVAPAPLAALLGDKAQGLGDLRFGAMAWLINDNDSANYLGVLGMLIAPTGDYDRHRALNAGENRWKMVLGGGWQKDITPQFLVELVPELAFYGDNDDYAGGRRLEQHPTYSLTSYLRYRVSPTWHLHLGGQINRGGDTRIAGVDQHNPANNDRAMAGVTFFLPKEQQVILRVARDIRIDNGLRTDQEIALRYQKAF